MADDEYEVLPHQLLSELKYDVEALKKKLNEPDVKANELILEMESMKDSVHELTNIFQKALEETKEEDLTTLIKTVNERLTAVISQNETIARGMIAISDKLEDWMKNQPAPRPMPASMPLSSQGVQHNLGLPLQPGRIAPRPMGAPALEMVEMPPPPPPGGAKKRSGLFKE